MNVLQIDLVIIYITIGVLWGVFASYMQYNLCKKNYLICWFLNTMFWPTGFGIVIYKTLKEENNKIGNTSNTELMSIIKLKEQYIELLTKELNEASSIACLHGWKSGRLNEGEKLRNRIIELVNNFKEQ